MVTIRPAKTTDILEMQHCNLYNLPENYNLRYWLYHAMSWPQLPQVAVDDLSGKVVGYVLAKMEDDEGKEDFIPHGHITSISVLREYRKLGLATKLMRAAQHQMKTIYEAHYCSLHVRVSNRAAITLYKDVLGYETMRVEAEYYADKEDAYDMKLFFNEATRAKLKKDAVEEPKESKDEETKESSEPASQKQEAAGEDAGKKKKKKNKKKKKAPEETKA